MCKNVIIRVLFLSLFLGTAAIAQINLFLPNTAVGFDEDLMIPIVTDPVDGYDVIACQFELTYDPNLLTVVDTSLSNTLCNQFFSRQINWSEPGKILFAGLSIFPVGGADTLIKILFHSTNNAGLCPLSFSQFQFNEGSPSVIVHDGSVQVGNIVNVFLPDTAVGSDVDLIVPIIVDSLDDYNVLSFDFNLIYDSNLLYPVDTLLANTLSKQFMFLQANWSKPDTISVAGFGINPLSGADTLIKILFHSTNNSGICALNFSGFQFNEGTPSTIIHPGTVWVNLAPIPVELSAFQCELRKGKVFLNWTTLSEKDNYGFSMQRAVCNNLVSKQKIQAWQTIAFIPGHGTTSEPHEYEFVDEVKNLVGKNCYLYYRFKQTDTDGSFKFSPIRHVRLLPLKFDLAQNFPNPFNANTKVTFISPFSGIVSLHLYNVLGQKIATLIDKKSIQTGAYDFEIQMTEYRAGVYFYQLVFIGEENFRQTRKMIYLK